jgi:hypothetical protein
MDAQSEGRMPTDHACGPDHEKEFFDALLAVFNQFPEAAKTYAVSCIDHETDIMKIDFTKEVGIARIEGKRVIMDFHDRGAASVVSDLICCKWWRESDSTWTCLKRWNHPVIEDPKTLRP